MVHVTIIGTVGIPANYGGFETLVENIISENVSTEIDYTVFCSSKSYPHKQSFYKNASLKYIPLEANGVQSIFYDILSLIRATRGSDIILILGVSGCCFLPIYRLFSSKKLVINIDGLEHRRDKWGKWTRRFLKFSESMAIRYADTIVSDNKGIQDYVKEEYGKESELIAYGGDHVLCDVSNMTKKVLTQYSLEGMEYSFSVCRIEPENNVHMTLEAFKRSGKNIVFVGNWKRSVYGIGLYTTYKEVPNIFLLEPVYDLKILNVLRANCKFYIHGHSAGGTNPSLVEAMFFQKPILAFDVIYNRETTENKADYFSSVEDLIKLLRSSYDSFAENAKSMLDIAQRRYRWKVIAEQYERLYH